MAEHRASVLSASLRRYPDPERSSDPRVCAVVSGLRSLDFAPMPRAHFRAELRSQLVAVAPRLVVEGPSIELPRVPASAPAPTSPARAAASPPRFATVFARMRNLSLGRPVAIVTALVAVFALLLGGAVYISKKALPGDTLYSLKRANETVQLSLADGSTAKSKAYLDFANERADEVLGLLKRASALAAEAGGPGPSAAGAISAHTASLVSSTLDSADSDVRNAAQLLGAQAASSGSASSLSTMTQWAPGQAGKLQTITDRIPAGALHDRATASLQLVQTALSRATELTALAGCSCLRSAATDDLGPLPCQPCNAAVTPISPTTPAGVPTTGAGPTNPATSSSAGAGSSSAAAATTTPAQGTAGAGTSPLGSSAAPVPPVPPLPSLPTHLPTLPTLPTITLPAHPNGGTSSTQSCLIYLLGICVSP